MDNKKLAELLYKEVKNWEDYEKMYPPRDLPQNAEVTRFAPSPTGYLHIGHFFQCLCDSFIAKNTKGVFYFRVEDTDKKREVTDSIDTAIKTLEAFDVHYDEGVLLGGQQKGNYGPYIQSERKEIYKAYAKKLVQDGFAYPCFCEKAENIEEIKEKRAEQLESNKFIEEKDPCRDLSLEQIQQNLKQNKPFALRLKSFGDPEKTFKFTDIVKGEREIRENSKDIILIKSNGLPVYSFAHAIDDHLMHTTIVVRGEEWFPSLASHLELFKDLGFKPVKYAHNPVICKLDENGGKRKISKRKDKEADMRFFIEAGYPVNAIKEYLLNLANSNFENWRKANPTISLNEFPFSAKKITQSNPMFDFSKLNDISKTYISTLSAEVLFDALVDYTKIYDKNFYEIITKDGDYTKKVLNIDREIKNPRKDIAKLEDVKNVWGYMFNELFVTNYELEDIDKKNIREIIENYIKIYKHNDSKDEWFNRIKDMSEKLGYAVDNKAYKQNPDNFKGNVAKVCEYIRIAITTHKNSPDLYSICQVLGEQETIQRLQNFLLY